MEMRRIGFKIGVLVAALSSAIALAAPAVASASSFWKPLPPPKADMYVDVSSSGGDVQIDVSLSDSIPPAVK